MDFEKFGICNGQMRSCDFVHNGGWYNKSGEKIGWGDLSPSDMKIKTEGRRGFYHSR